MAVEFGVEHKKRNEYLFFPEHIKIKPELNGRHDLPDIEWLINDILQHGQIQPIAIRKDGDRPVLVAGFSRYRAVSEINKRKLAGEKMSLICKYVQVNEQQAFLMNISENRFRNEVTPLDDAYNIQRLLNVYHMDEPQVAAFYFPTAKTEKELKDATKFVRERVALIALTPEAADAVRKGRVKPNAAQAIAKLSEDQQRELIKRTEGNETISKSDVAPTKAKVVKFNNDPELVRRASAVINDCRAGIEANTEEYIEVTHKLLKSLMDYLDDKKG